MLKVAREPVVADFVDWNNVDGLIDSPLGGNAKGSVAANCLYVHSADFESDTFKQKAIVVKLDTPVEQITNTVVAQFRLEFVLPLLEPRLVDLACVNFDFVNAKGFHKFEAGSNFQVAQHAFIGVKNFAEKVELPGSDVVL